MAATTSIPGLRFIRGRTEKTRNAVYGGYRYGSPSQLKTGKTSWSCIRKDCNGRIYTIGDTHVEARKEHNHEPDLSLCEAKICMSEAKDHAETSRTGSAVIIADTSKPLSKVARTKLPKDAAWKKQLQRLRQKQDGRPMAPKLVTDIQLTPADCITANGQHMLLYDNQNPEHRLIIFGTDQCLRLLERYQSWLIDGTFQKCPEHFYQLVNMII